MISKYKNNATHIVHRDSKKKKEKTKCRAMAAEKIRCSRKLG
jgi:hypothetical protein